MLLVWIGFGVSYAAAIGLGVLLGRFLEARRRLLELADRDARLRQEMAELGLGTHTRPKRTA